MIGLRALWSAAGEAARRMFGPPRVALQPRSLPLARIGKLRLTDAVSRTLFAEYAAHRTTERGEEETGWALLGHRDGDEAIALATLPAGAQRQAGSSHVQFHRTAQAVASRIVRQNDRRLTLLGIVHTHPGSLRHPSDGDFRGDVEWVRQLRGREGIFGIGTADGPDDETGIAIQPKLHQQCQGGLRWSWYALAADDRHYRPLTVELTLGPDLAASLRPIWDVIEVHAARLDRLTRQIAGVSFEVCGTALAVQVPVADGGVVRAVLEGKAVRYYIIRGDDVSAADLPEQRVDQGVLMLLAELAARPPADENP